MESLRKIVPCLFFLMNHLQGKISEIFRQMFQHTWGTALFCFSMRLSDDETNRKPKD